MLLQRPSQAIVSLEWDSIWALNKKVIDPVAPRFWAILQEKKWVIPVRTICIAILRLHSVPVSITNGPAIPEVKTLPKHKKNPDVGEKKTVYTSTILVEQEDASSFEDQEEVRGTCYVQHIRNQLYSTVDHSHELGQCIC